MIKTGVRILSNVFYGAIHRDDRCGALFPLYHVTPFCNLKCSYCDGFPELNLPREKAVCRSFADRHLYELSTSDVKKLLAILRRSFDFIFLTGGEPLVRDDIEEIVEFAGSLRFTGISMNTNSILLPRKETLLAHISNLVVSLDMLDVERYCGILGCGRDTVDGIIGNVKRYKELEKKYRYMLKVHTVILPGAVDRAEEVLDLCLGLDVAICLSPLQVRYTAHASFKDDPAYRALIDRLIDLKKRGRKISGTFQYYRNIRDLARFRCVPLLVPRILPDGRILYPCRPKGRIAGSILQFGSWERALEEARRDYGENGECERSCRIRCYIEPSLLMKSPVSMAREFLEQI